MCTNFKRAMNFFCLQLLIFHMHLTLCMANSNTSMSILFVHIGEKFLTFQKTTISQARLFNPHNKIYLIVSENFSNKKHNTEFLDQYNVTFIPIESLSQTEHHKRFNNFWLSKPNRRIYEFWHFTTERFFIVEEFMTVHNVENIMHIESDNMIYFAVDEFRGAFCSLKNVATVFDNNDRAVPGIVYIRNAESAHDLGKYVNFQNGKFIDYLPIMPASYTKHYKLNNSKDRTDEENDAFSKHYEVFNKTIFDSAGIGQYVGGTNEEFKPKGSNSTIGYVNPHSVMDVRRLTYEWRRDILGRLILFAIFNPPRARNSGDIEEIKVNNIHVHCKHTEQFYSLRKPKNCTIFVNSDYFSLEQKNILKKLHNLECSDSDMNVT